MRMWLFGAGLGIALAVVSLETSLIGMVLAVAALVFLGLNVRPRYAFLSGALIGMGGVLFAATVATLPCEASVAACGNPYPFIGLAGALVLAGLIAGVPTKTRRRYGPVRRGWFWSAVILAAIAAVIAASALSEIFVGCDTIAIGLGRPLCEASLGRSYITLAISLAIVAASAIAAVAIWRGSKGRRIG